MNNLVVADFDDDDGRPDFAWGIGSMVGVYLNRGGGSFEEVDTTTTTVTPYSESIAGGDFDRDGLPDLIAAGDGHGNPSFVDVLYGTGNGTFEITELNQDFQSPMAVAAGDLTGDGWPDFVVVDPPAGRKVLLNDREGDLEPSRSKHPASTCDPSPWEI
jgi:hypothetical protein